MVCSRCVGTRPPPGADTYYRYVLTGHAVRGGFAGTFDYTKPLRTINCSSRLLRWTAHPMRGGANRLSSVRPGKDESGLRLAAKAADREKAARQQ
jgi:hypothetical protein